MDIAEEHHCTTEEGIHESVYIQCSIVSHYAFM